MLKDIVEARPLEGYRIHLRFEDGAEGEVDLSTLVEFKGVFALLRDPEEVRKVTVHPELGTICWPNGADLDPDVLYSHITGHKIELEEPSTFRDQFGRPPAKHLLANHHTRPAPLEAEMHTTRISNQQGLAILNNLASVATGLQGGLLPLVHRVSFERQLFGEQRITLEEISFWFKCLIHESLSFIDGLCNNIREILARFIPELEPELTPKQVADITDSTLILPLRRIVPLTFRALPKLFGASFVLDTGSADYRAFAAMIRARSRFTHPKSPSDIHPLETLATMNSALEWVLFAWRDLLLSCSARVQGVPQEEVSPPERRFRFSDQRLVDFEELGREYAVSRRAEGTTADLAAMIFGLLDDTKRAVTLAIGREEQGGSLPEDLAMRNVVRFLFTEIEGSVFVAASYLYRYGFVNEKPVKELLTGGNEAVREGVLSTLEAFSRHFGNDVSLSRQGLGWEAFSVGRDLRNRIVHPKRPEDLVLRPGEFEQLMQIHRWWHGELHDCLNLSQDSAKLLRLIERERGGLRSIDEGEAQ